MGEASRATDTKLGRDVSQSPTLAHTGTAAGLILGTAAYMSPEQARGKPRAEGGHDLQVVLGHEAADGLLELHQQRERGCLDAADVERLGVAHGMTPLPRVRAPSTRAMSRATEGFSATNATSTPPPRPRRSR